VDRGGDNRKFNDNWIPIFRYLSTWTAHSNRYSDILEYFVTKLPNHLTTRKYNICDVLNDYSPVILTLRGNPAQNIRPPLTNGPINWTTFKNHLDNTIHFNISLKTYDEVINSATLLVNISKNQSLP